MKKETTKKTITKIEPIRSGKSKFNFSNGDSYEGEYIVLNNKEIYRHGKGVYTTNDHDKYYAIWEKDHMTSDVHIFYSNKAEFCGKLDTNGAMSGNGTYIFPDQTALNATWINNEPMDNYFYKDPLGNNWMGKLSSHKSEVIFDAENRIWEKRLD